MNMKKFNFIPNTSGTLSLFWLAAVILSIASVAFAATTTPETAFVASSASETIAATSTPMETSVVAYTEDAMLFATSTSSALLSLLSSSPPPPQGFIADKSFYTVSDAIKISNAPQGSAIEIYWLDNPDTALNTDPDSSPSNVYATLVNDDGTVDIDVATLPPGRFVFANTFEPGHCGGFYLSQCQARSDYLGEISLSANP